MTQPTSDAVRQGEWIEEFDKKFVIQDKRKLDFPFVAYEDADSGTDYWRADVIKSFIQQEKDKSYQEGKEAVRKELAAVDPVWLAECFHDFYESYAKIKGWKTQENCTNIPFKDLPEENKQTMICTASSVLHELTGKLALLSLLTPKTK